MVMLVYQRVTFVFYDDVNVSTSPHSPKPHFTYTFYTFTSQPLWAPRNVSIRGAILKGMCISTKMKRTIIIRRNYLHYIKNLGATESHPSTGLSTKVLLSDEHSHRYPLVN
jgi:hypothetical protein